MLCSAPPPSKSGSNWLDRLRSNKGFPTATADEEDNKSLGLDHFLQNQDPIESTRSNPSSTQSNHEPVANRTHENGHKKEQLYSLMSNVLSELFFMDDDNHFQSSKLSGKKFPRKQTTPKSLTTSTNSNVHLPRQEEEEEEKSLARAERNAGPTASFNSDNSMKQTKVGNVEEEEAEMGEDEEKEEVRELVGYSRSEVTVIDTSFGVWKSEKVVYRRKNVWKVREKRGKVKSFGRKKRKGSGGCNDGNGGDENVVGAMKKAKVSCSESAAALNRVRDFINFFMPDCMYASVCNDDNTCSFDVMFTCM